MAEKKSSVLQSMLLSAQERFGERAYTGKESDLYLTGILLKPLSLRWLFDSNVFPVSKLLRIYGEPRSQKSTLSYEFMRLFGDAGCEVLGYVENESGKYSPSMLKSILGKYEYLITNTATCEEAQMALNGMRKEFQRLCPDRDKLACFVLDSLFGTSSEDKHKQLNKLDHTEKSYPVEANKWSSFLQTYTAELLGWPIAFIMTNHAKLDINDTRSFNGPGQRTPGGSAQHFHSAVDIEVMREANPHQFVELSYEGKVTKQPHMRLKLFLKTNKSSIGSDNRRVQVNMLFWNDENNQQTTFFDWWGADAVLFHAMVSGGDNAPIIGNRKALRDVCDVDVEGGLFTSKALGVKKVTPHEFGWALQANKEIFEKVSFACGVKEHPVFNGQMPQCIKDAAKRKKETKEEEKKGSPLDQFAAEQEKGR
jgi:hypothetical protein